MRRRVRAGRSDSEWPAKAALARSASVRQGSVASLPAHRHLAQLPGGPAPGAVGRAALLQMQRDYGNARVQRYLDLRRAAAGAGAPGATGVLQRAPGPAGSTAAGGAQAPQGTAGKPKDPLAELLAKQLGEDKLKEYGDKLAEKAAGALMEQVKGATSQADFIQKAQIKLVGDQLNSEIAKGVEDLLKSEQGQKLRSLVVGAVKAEPRFALGMVLSAAALAVAADAPAKLDLDGKIGKSGFSWAAKADLGSLRNLSLQYLEAGLKYSNESFKMALSASYGGEKGKLGDEQIEVGKGAEKAQTSGAASIDAKNNEVKAELGTTINSPQLAVASKLQFDKGIGGSFVLKLGGEEKNLATEVKLGSDGKVSLKFNHKLSYDVVKLSTTFDVDKTEMRHELDLNQPFGVKDLKVTANISYAVVDPTITAADLTIKYKLVDKTDAPVPLLVFGVTGEYQARQGDKPASFQGLAVIQGRF